MQNEMKTKRLLVIAEDKMTIAYWTSSPNQGHNQLRSGGIGKSWKGNRLYNFFVKIWVME